MSTLPFSWHSFEPDNSRPGVLSVAQNSPQRVKYELYAEAVSIISF